jgi:hypothetical protein
LRRKVTRPVRRPRSPKVISPCDFTRPPPRPVIETIRFRFRFAFGTPPATGVALRPYPRRGRFRFPRRATAFFTKSHKQQPPDGEKQLRWTHWNRAALNWVGRGTDAVRRWLSR